MSDVQQSSLNAFYEVLENGTAQSQCQRIMAFLCLRLNATNREISESTGITINAVTARVHAMRKRGLIVLDSQRKCHITKHTVNAWRLL